MYNSLLQDGPIKANEKKDHVTKGHFSVGEETT
jgi:hypothetical protein